MQSPGFKTRLTWLLLVLLALMALSGFMALQRLRQVAASISTVYQDRVLPLQQLRLVHNAYRVQIVDALTLAREGSLSQGQALRDIDQARQIIKNEWQRYLQTYLVEDEQRLIAQAEPLMRQANAQISLWQELLQRQDAAALASLNQAKLIAVLQPLAERLDQLIVLQLKVADEENLSSKAAYDEAIFVIISLTVVTGLAGACLGWAVFARYRLEGMDLERRRERLQRFYMALSQTNQLIVRERDEAVLLTEICGICVRTGHAGCCAIGMIDNGHLVRTAHAGPQDGFLAGLPQRWDLNSDEARRSVTGTAWASGRYAVCQDFLEDLSTLHWHERALKSGLRSMAAFPIRRNGQVFGMLALYAGEPNFFDAPLLDLLNEMVGDLSYALDDIDRERARQTALDRAERDREQFRLLFHIAPVATLIISMQSRKVLDINSLGARRYGLSREQLIGHSLQELGVGLLPHYRRALYERLEADGRVSNMEVQLQGKSGPLLWVLLSAELITYQGETCMLAMSLDVTGLRQAEKAREEQQAAVAANRAKTAFLSRMSHELRTPLNAVLGFSKLLMAESDGRLDPRQLNQLGHVQSAGWHLLALVNDVLDVARIEAGSLQLHARPLTLLPLLQEALDMTEALARQQGITLLLPPDEALTVRADPIRLRQALINVLSNAIKYNRPGGRVDVSCEAQQGWVQIEIADTGLGMSAEQLAHLYEPFNRLGREASEVEGSGVGLTLTRQLMQLMQGDIEVDSQPGQGTRVRLRLPGGSDAAATEPGALDALPDLPATPVTGRVLYVEDNPVNMLLVEQMLARLPGVELLQARTGAEGLALAAGLKPELLLLDLDLPDISGLEVLRQLRANPATAGLKVVALSAGAMAEEVQTALQAGAHDYWTKPLDLEPFLAGVSRLLSCERAA
nr:ATP-binding protein [uncultured Roseateles sp.]